jgi:hypothetical protein
VHAPCSYDYAVIRVVPRVERQEFINAGVIIWCQERDLLEARTQLDEARLLALHTEVDIEAVRRHLASFAIICAGGENSGPIGQLGKRERLIGWWPRAAPSSSARPCTAGVARMPSTLLKACWSGWCGKGDIPHFVVTIDDVAGRPLTQPIVTTK